MTDDERQKLKESLDKLTKEDLADLALAMKEQLTEQTESARAERVKILHDFFHPSAPTAAKEEATPDKEEYDPLEAPAFKKLQKKFKYM